MHGARRSSLMGEAPTFGRQVTRRKFLQAAGATMAVGPLIVPRSPTGKGATVEFIVLGATKQELDFFNNQLVPDLARTENIKVQLQTAGWSDAYQKYTTGAASGQLPDVLTLGGLMLPPLASKDVLVPLDRFTSSWSEHKQYYANIWDDCIYHGKTYAVPYAADIRTSVYRSDLLEKAGLSISNFPKTWDEFQSYAKQIHNHAGGAVSTESVDWGLDPAALGLQQSFFQLLVQAGGNYFNKSGSPSFHTKAGLRALNYLTGFFKSHLSSVNVTSPTGAPSPLVSGSAAMTLTGVGIVTNAESADASVVPHLKAGPPLKHTQSSKPATTAYVNKYAISAKSRAPEAAWKVIQYLSRPANLKIQLAASGQLPPRKGLSVQAYLPQADPEFIAAQADVIPQPRNPAMLQVVPIIEQQLQRAIRFEAPPDEILQTIDSQVRPLVGK